MAKGTLTNSVILARLAARRIAADAPPGLRMAATITSVSATTLTSPMISHRRRCYTIELDCVFMVIARREDAEPVFAILYSTPMLNGATKYDGISYRKMVCLYGQMQSFVSSAPSVVNQRVPTSPAPLRQISYGPGRTDR